MLQLAKFQELAKLQRPVLLLRRVIPLQPVLLHQLALQQLVQQQLAKLHQIQLQLAKLQQVQLLQVLPHQVQPLVILLIRQLVLVNPQHQHPRPLANLLFQEPLLIQLLPQLQVTLTLRQPSLDFTIKQ